ncbi:response regulator transcription factor [Cytophagaceae bacterium ABcell3]|nr:response regulator transcription factor [Cytophagaceae bacterium ABcell3]
MKKVILTVDDSTSILSLMPVIFGPGHTVVKARNGAEAMLKLYDGLFPDLIITDLKMPEVDGFDFIERVRCAEAFCKIPIFVLSGSDRSTDKVKCFKLGADDYMSKPFNPEELMMRATNLLGRKRHASVIDLAETSIS